MKVGVGGLLALLGPQFRGPDEGDVDRAVEKRLQGEVVGAHRIRRPAVFRGQRREVRDQTEVRRSSHRRADRTPGCKLGERLDVGVGGDEDVLGLVVRSRQSGPVGITPGDQLEAHVNVTVLQHDRIDYCDVLHDDLAFDHVSLRLEQQGQGDGVGDGVGHFPGGVALIHAVAKLRLIQPSAEVPLAIGVGHIVEFRLLSRNWPRRQRGHQNCQRQRQKRTSQTWKRESNGQDKTSQRHRADWKPPSPPGPGFRMRSAD